MKNFLMVIMIGLMSSMAFSQPYETVTIDQSGNRVNAVQQPQVMTYAPVQQQMPNLFNNLIPQNQFLIGSQVPYKYESNAFLSEIVGALKPGESVTISISRNIGSIATPDNNAEMQNIDTEQKQQIENLMNENNNLKTIIEESRKQFYELSKQIEGIKASSSDKTVTEEPVVEKEKEINLNNGFIISIILFIGIFVFITRMLK